MDYAGVLAGLSFGEKETLRTLIPRGSRPTAGDFFRRVGRVAPDLAKKLKLGKEDIQPFIALLHQHEGSGPRGQAGHAGSSPEAAPVVAAAPSPPPSQFSLARLGGDLVKLLVGILGWVWQMYWRMVNRIAEGQPSRARRWGAKALGWVVALVVIVLLITNPFGGPLEVGRAILSRGADATTGTETPPMSGAETDWEKVFTARGITSEQRVVIVRLLTEKGLLAGARDVNPLLSKIFASCGDEYIKVYLRVADYVQGGPSSTVFCEQ